MNDKPAESLAAALALVQSQLPTIGKTQEANAGTYKYHYADLADVSKKILPLLGKHGLAWITKPTFVDGRFVLAYALRHGASGQAEEGVYPLPDKGSPQQIGSAITYARRYTLCSVSGVAPESDDDDAQAASQRPDQWDDATPAKPPTDEQTDLFGTFRLEIATVQKLEEMAPIGARAEKALKDKGITKAQYDHLDRAAARRLAELQQAAS